MLLFVTDILRAILPGLLLAITSGAIGCFFLGRILNNINGKVCWAPLQIGFGFAILMVIFNFLLVLGILSPFNGCLAVLLLLSLLWKQAAFSLKAFMECLTKFYCWVVQKPIRIVPTMIVLATFLLGFIGLMAPSTGYDSTVYHLTLPKIYAGAEGFVPRPDIIQSRYPQNLTSLRTFSYQLGGEEAIEFLNMMACGLLFWLIFELTAVFNIKRRWKGWSVIILCGSLQLIFYLYDADVEGWLAFFMLCLFTCAILLETDLSIPLLVSGGLFGGCLIGIKPTTIPALGILFMIAIVRVSLKKKRIPWEAVLIPSSIATFVGCFWYIVIFKINGHLYGTEIIGMGIPLFSIDRFHFKHALETARSLITYNAPILIYLLMVPLMLKIRVGRIIFLIFLLLTFLIFATNPWPGAFARYTYFMSPLLVLGILTAFTRIDRMASRLWKAIRIFAVALISIFLIITTFANIYRNIPKVPVCFRKQQRESYLTQRVNTFQAIQFANSIVPSNGKLLMVGERSYWLDIPYILGIERNPDISYSDMSLDCFFQLLQRESISHILFNTEKADYTSEFLEFWQNHPGLQTDPKLELMHRNIWQGSRGDRASYVYRVRIPPIPNFDAKKKSDG